MTDHDRNNSRRWRITGEIVFVPFLACFAVIIFHSVLFAAEDRDAIRKSIRMTAHDDFGGKCPFRACPSLLSKPAEGAIMTIELDRGTDQPAERQTFRFSGKTSQWIPVDCLKPESIQGIAKMPTIKLLQKGKLP